MNDGVHLLKTLPPEMARIVAAVARSIPCTPGQAVLACLLLVDRSMGRFVQAVDADGRIIETPPLDSCDFNHVFRDLSTQARAQLFARLEARLGQTLARFQQSRGG
jgi:hypothetical protein